MSFINKRKIHAGHFEVGSKLHSDTFFEVKPIFGEYDKLKKILQKLENFIKAENLIKPYIFGFKEYLMPLLELSEYKYSIIESNSANYFWSLKKPSIKIEQNSSIILLVPISVTWSNSVSIIKFLEEHFKIKLSDYPNFKILSVFQIFPQDFIKSFKYPIKSRLVKIYQEDFNWQLIDTNFKIIKDNYNFNIEFLIKLEAKYYPNDFCPKCNPKLNKKDNEYDYETPIIPLYIDSESVNLIKKFNSTFYPNEFRKNNLNSLDFYNFFYNGRHPIISYGGIKLKSTYFNTFFNGNIFFDKNRNKITEKFNNIIKNICIDFKYDKVVLVTSENKFSSPFETLIANIFIKNRKQVNIIKYQVADEFTESFIENNKELLKNDNNLLIFIEDVVSTATSFKILSDAIKNTKFKPNCKFNLKAFDYLFCLIDRSSYFTKIEVLKKLQKKFDTKLDINCFNSFVNVNVPVSHSLHIENPVKVKEDELKNISTNCRLEVTQLKVYDELEKNKSIDFLEYFNEQSSPKNNLTYYPFSEVVEKKLIYFEHYLDKFDKQHYYLLKIYLIHYINNHISKIKQENIIEELFRIINENLGDFFIFFIKPDRFDSITAIEKKIIKNILEENILKILSRPPFIYNENIYKQIFEKCVIELRNLSNYVGSNGRFENFVSFRKFKFLLNRITSLNSSYILSKDFLDVFEKHYDTEKINQYFNILDSLKLNKTNFKNLEIYEKNNEYKKNQVINYFSYLLMLYKRLLYKRPHLITILIQNIESKEQLKLNGVKKLEELKKRINTTFYRFGATLYTEFYNPNNEENAALDRIRRTFLSNNNTENLLNIFKSTLKTINKNLFKKGINCDLLLYNHLELSNDINYNNLKLINKSNDYYIGIPKDTNSTNIFIELLKGFKVNKMLKKPHTSIICGFKSNKKWFGFADKLYSGESDVEIDFNEYCNNTQFLNDKRSFLAIRISDIYLDNNTFKNNANGILIISSNDNDISTIKNIIDNNKLALLILLKKDLYDYIRNCIKTNAFTEAIKSEENEKLAAENEFRANIVKEFPHLIPTLFMAVENQTDSDKIKDSIKEIRLFLTNFYAHLKNSTVTLNEEIKICEEYIKIFMLKHPNSTVKLLNYTDNKGAKLIPAGTITSIINNALTHGRCYEMQKGGVIEIKTNLNEISITSNGIKIPYNINEIFKKESGIYKINKNLKLLNKTKDDCIKINNDRTGFEILIKNKYE